MIFNDLLFSVIYQKLTGVAMDYPILENRLQKHIFYFLFNVLCRNIFLNCGFKQPRCRFWSIVCRFSTAIFSFKGEENIICIYTTFPLLRILLLHKWCNNVLRQLFPLPKKPLHIYLQYERIGLFRYEFSSLVLLRICFFVCTYTWSTYTAWSRLLRNHNSVQ